METKITNLKDLQAEKLRLRQELKVSKDKLKVHFTNLSDELTPIVSVLDSIYKFTGKGGHKDDNASLISLTGTVLKIGLPIILSRFISQKTSGNSWWAELLRVVLSFVDKEVILKVVESIGSKKEEGKSEL